MSEDALPLDKDLLLVAECGEHGDVAQRLARDVRRLLSVIDEANNALMDSAVHDIEHQIDCHADTLPQAFRQVAEGAEKALEILQVVVCELVEG